MQLLWTLCIAALSASTLTRAQDSPKCPSETPEVMSELKKLTTSKDIFNELLGRHLTLWGPQAILDKDNTTKLDYEREKKSATEFSETTYIQGLELGNQTRTSTWMKSNDGTYLVKRAGKNFAKVYNIYYENNITAQYTCLFNPKDDAVLPPYFTTITAPTKLIMNSDSAPYKIFKSVVDIVKMIESKKQVLGQIAAFDFSQVY